MGLPRCRPVLPADEVENMLARSGEYESISEAEIAARLRALKDDSASWSMPDEHWSLPGQQEKFTLAHIDGWNLAKGSAATTHIVKPGISRLRHQALVEHVTIRAAVGVDIAETQFMRFEDQAAIVVTRFDRHLAHT